MKNYEKPIVLVNSDCSEGVYTASGAITINGSIESSQLNAEGLSFKEYKVKIKNMTNEGIKTVTAIIKETGTGVKEVYSDNLRCERNGNGTVTLTFDNYGKGFDPIGISDVAYIKVYGNEPYGLEEIF